MIWTDEVINQFSRENTVEALGICRKYALVYEEYDQKIASKNKEIEKINVKYAGKGKAPVLLVGVALAVVVFLILSKLAHSTVLALIFTVGVSVAYYGVIRKTLESVVTKMTMKHLESKMQTEIQPHMQQIALIKEEQRNFVNGEEMESLLRFLPAQYFSSQIISYLLNLFQTRRANTLAEALNAYEQDAHNKRLENAANISAAANVSAAQAQWQQLDAIHQQTDEMRAGFKNVADEQKKTRSAINNLTDEQRRTTSAVQGLAREQRRTANAAANAASAANRAANAAERSAESSAHVSNLFSEFMNR